MTYADRAEAVVARMEENLPGRVPPAGLRILRMAIAIAIREAVEEERERIAARLDEHARTLVERAEADPLTEKYSLPHRQAARNAAAELRDAALLTREGR